MDSRPRKTNLDAAAQVLAETGRALHAKDIAKLIIEKKLGRLSGSTPWKTVTAKISVDILRHAEHSRFQRSGHDLFALRVWGEAADFAVKRRRINPIDENIMVVPRSLFSELIGGPITAGLRQVDVKLLISNSVTMKRADAETTTDYVQIIPTFLIRKDRKILCYKRTKRLPESRLHHSWCVSFGGHLQSSDEAGLFLDEDRVFWGFIYRELFEELRFSDQVEPEYLGVLYLEENDFERQHAGIVFDVRISSATVFTSLEPGMHTDVRFVDVSDLAAQASELDSWSKLLIEVATHES